MVNRVAIGSLGAGKFGLRTSAPGIDVLNASVNQRWFDSDEYALGVFDEGQVIVANNGVGTVAIAGLSVVPRVLVTAINAPAIGSFSNFVAYEGTLGGGISNILRLGFVINVTNDTLAILNATGADTTFGYTIFHERIN